MGLSAKFNRPVAGLQLRLEKMWLFFLNLELSDMQIFYQTLPKMPV